MGCLIQCSPVGGIVICYSVCRPVRLSLLGGARNMKSMRPPLVAIFFMTNFYRAGGAGPLAHPLDPLLTGTLVLVLPLPLDMGPHCAGAPPLWTWDLAVHGPLPSVSNIWWPKLETYSNLFTWLHPNTGANIWWLWPESGWYASY